MIDLDNTLCTTIDGDYRHSEPVREVVEVLRKYHESGTEVVIYTARNMRTYSGVIGKINSNTLPIIVDWLRKHEIPFDEIIVGKPWCGFDGYYVDDRAIRPDEFVSMTPIEIEKLLSK